MGDEGPDRSSIEIKQLLRKLDPKSGSNHKDRVRLLNRFRNYVTGAATKHKSTPEFYDDDLPLLYLGSQSPTALYDPELSSLNLYGLLQACGSPSSDHSGGLKRSARNAMNLLKFLVCDYCDVVNGRANPPPLSDGRPGLNSFAHALCCCTTAHLRLMSLEVHIMDTGGHDSRGGAKTDACQVTVLLLTRHLTENGERDMPLALDQLLPTAAARKGFETWLTKNATREVQRAVKKASATAAAGPGEAGQSAAAGPESRDNHNLEEGEELGIDVLNAFTKKKTNKITGAADTDEEKAIKEAEAHAEEQLDELGLRLYKKDRISRQNDDDLPTCWADSRLATTAAPFELSAEATAREAKREITERSKDRQRQEEEKQKLTGRDPLGIRGEDFDLRLVEARKKKLLKDALRDLEEVMVDEHPERKVKDNALEQLVSVEAQMKSLETILEGKHRAPIGVLKRGVSGSILGDTDLDVEDDEGDVEAKNGIEKESILPTDPNFNPLLFLTLVHRNASFEELQSSIMRVSNKTDNQVQRLQNLVRDNFALFVRCADGTDLFSEQSEKRQKNKSGVKQRLDRLDTLAQSCSEQAKKSFKPLLDNTNEVRKVQSALSVLNRIGPLLQIPNLMRQHIENGRFSEAVKAYRRVLVIDDDNKIALLKHVKLKATEAARDARRNLEATLVNQNVPVQTLLDAIRDLGELIELDIPVDSTDMKEGDNDGTDSANCGNREHVAADGGDDELIVVPYGNGKCIVGGKTINVRDYSPALACLILQAAHFSLLADKSVAQTDDSIQRVYAGESVSTVREEGDEQSTDEKSVATTQSTDDSKGSDRRDRNRWKYDVLEARVISTVRAVGVLRTWLPRLLRIGVAAREAERRLAARSGRTKPGGFETKISDELQTFLTAFEVFVTNISPSVMLLVEHATFCALGCSNNSDGEEPKMTFGHDADSHLQVLLKAPLPPAQSAKCAIELADMVVVVQNVAAAAGALRPMGSDIDAGKGASGLSGSIIGGSVTQSHYRRIAEESPLERCTRHAEEAVVTVERRRCIYAFDVCARNCSMRASGSGTFDGEALLLCVQKLSEELTRPEECANEVEKGCELVVRRCCEGLASYVRDRGDTARLRAVAECANALNECVTDVVREVAYLTNGQCITAEETLVDEIMALEGVMFDEYLENIRRNVTSCTRLGPVETVEAENHDTEQKETQVPFPAYLSSSLLSIVRCRAQVERALGETTVRRSQQATYQFLAMSTAADSVIDAICCELNDRMSRMRGKQSDRFANELQFLIGTLRRYLSDPMLEVGDNCMRMLLCKAGRSGGIQGDGPDGLAAIEALERLGRVYVLCLGE